MLPVVQCIRCAAYVFYSYCCKLVINADVSRFLATFMCLFVCSSVFPHDISTSRPTSVFGDGRKLISTQADPTSTRRAILIGTRLRELFPPLTYTSGWVADSSDFGLLGSKVPQNGRFPAQDADELTYKI